ncbi:MAG: hypothetical protein ACK55I_45075, partial [bacterium]
MHHPGLTFGRQPFDQLPKAEQGKAAGLQSDIGSRPAAGDKIRSGGGFPEMVLPNEQIGHI